MFFQKLFGPREEKRTKDYAVKTELQQENQQIAEEEDIYPHFDVF